MNFLTVFKSLLCFIFASSTLSIKTVEEFTDFLVDFELIKGLIDDLRAVRGYTAKFELLKLASEFIRMETVLYTKRVLRQFCGKNKTGLPHYNWLINMHEIHVANPWTRNFDYSTFKNGALSEKVMTLHFNDSRLTDEVTELMKSGSSALNPETEPSNVSVIKEAKRSLMKFLCSKVESMVLELIKTKFGGELIPFRLINSYFNSNIPIPPNLKTIPKSQLIFNNLPKIVFYKQ